MTQLSEIINSSAAKTSLRETLRENGEEALADIVWLNFPPLDDFERYHTGGGCYCLRKDVVIGGKNYVFVATDMEGSALPATNDWLMGLYVDDGEYGNFGRELALVEPDPANPKNVVSSAF